MAICLRYEQVEESRICKRVYKGTSPQTIGMFSKVNFFITKHVFHPSA